MLSHSHTLSRAILPLPTVSVRFKSRGSGARRTQFTNWFTMEPRTGGFERLCFQKLLRDLAMTLQIFTDLVNT